MHTKLPWAGQDKNGKWLESNQWSAEHESASCSSSAPIHADGKVVALVVSTDYDDSELEANAALIVRAVNSHADLITAVKSLIEWIDAVPEETILPAMPGLDRDWLETILDKAQS